MAMLRQLRVVQIFRHSCWWHQRKYSDESFSDADEEKRHIKRTTLKLAAVVLRLVLMAH